MPRPTTTADNAKNAAWWGPRDDFHPARNGHCGILDEDEDEDAAPSTGRRPGCHLGQRLPQLPAAPPPTTRSATISSSSSRRHSHLHLAAPKTDR